MKKILLFAALLLLGRGAFAQAGSLTIINNLTCDVTVGLYATETILGNGAGCSLVSYFFVVPALTTMSWSDPSNFTVYGGPSPAIGWSSQLVPIPASYWTSPCCSLIDFRWTDAQFQFGCLDCGTNGAVSDPGPISTCFSDLPTWSGGACFYNAKWSTSYVYPMNNVTLTFF